MSRVTSKPSVSFKKLSSLPPSLLLAFFLSFSLIGCGGGGGGGSSGGGGGGTVYTVSFYDGGVLLPDLTLTVEKGKAITLPPFASACYGFDGWQLNGAGDALTGSYTVEGDLRFDAKFSEPVYIDISTPQELDDIRDDLSGKYKLMNDISLEQKYSPIQPIQREEVGENLDEPEVRVDREWEWTPIGSASDPFSGCLDGNGFKITNLFVDVTSQYAGLFGYIDGGEISNIGVETAGGGVNNNSSGNGYAGIIAAYVGIGTITDSYAAGDVNSSSSSSYAGGLVGFMRGGTITNSYAAGDVNSSSSSESSYSYAGGLVGWMDGGTITNSYAAGDVNSSSSSSSSDSYAGGLVGFMFNSSITNSVAANPRIEITQGATKYMGRIVGDIYNSTVNNNFALDTMQAAGGSFNANHGIDKTNTQLKDPATYENAVGSGGLGWQFGGSGEAIWKMPSGGGYPILYWQTEP